MRQFIDIITEAFETSDYGYWIMPSGQIIPCSVMTHGEAAAYQLGKDFPEDDEEAERQLVDEAIADGAIRVVAPKGSGEFAAEWGMSVSTEARRAFLDVLHFYQGREAFILQNEYFGSYRDALSYARMA